MKTAFSKRSTLESVFEKLRFCDRKRRLRVDANPKRIKKMRFQKYPDTCERGLRVEIERKLETSWPLYWMTETEIVRLEKGESETKKANRSVSFYYYTTCPDKPIGQGETTSHSRTVLAIKGWVRNCYDYSFKTNLSTTDSICLLPCFTFWASERL